MAPQTNLANLSRTIHGLRPAGRHVEHNETVIDRIESINCAVHVPVESDGAGLRAGKPEVFLQTPADERHPSFSPDGRWLAYISNESGAYQVYVRAFPDKGVKVQISNSGGTYPVWARNGRELFFRTTDQIMVADYTVKGDSFVASKPRLWSEKRLADYGAVGYGTYDLAPDGKRIAALMQAAGSERRRPAENHVSFYRISSTRFDGGRQREANDQETVAAEITPGSAARHVR